MSNLGLRLASSKVPRTASCSYNLKSRLGTRNIHKRKELGYPIEKGLGHFLPPAALKTVAIEYQDGLLQRLNEEVKGTPEENTSIVQTIINTAPHRQRTLAFNYASLALNNHFFLECLKPPPAVGKSHQAEVTSHFANSIRLQHGNLGQLKSAFSSAVMGMFTNGYVWFVTDKHGNTGVVPTLGPGTLLIRSRTYMAHTKDILIGDDLGQPYRGHPGMDMSPFPRSPTAQQSPPGVNPSSPVSGVAGTSTPTAPSNLLPRFMHTTSSTHSSFNLGNTIPTGIYEGDPTPRNEPMDKTEMLNIGEVLYPLFCISVHEHAWMAAGYGVWGKEEWLKNFWSVLDWRKVSKAYEDIYGDKSGI